MVLFPNIFYFLIGILSVFVTWRSPATPALQSQTICSIKNKICLDSNDRFGFNSLGNIFIAIHIAILEVWFKRISLNNSISSIASSKTKCNKRVSLSKRCRRSWRVARGCLPLSERKKKQPAIQIKKGDRSLPKIN